MIERFHKKWLLSSLAILAVSLIQTPAGALAKAPDGKPILAMYIVDGPYMDWEHQSISIHFLLDDGNEFPDYEIPDPSQAIVWRSTDSGDNWYDITDTADASLTGSTLTLSNLDENILDIMNPDVDNSGYCFQIELPEDGPVDRYSKIFRVFLLDEETLKCMSDLGGNRGGGNRHHRPPSVTQPLEDDGENSSQEPQNPDNATTPDASRPDSKSASNTPSTAQNGNDGTPGASSGQASGSSVPDQDSASSQQDSGSDITADAQASARISPSSDGNKSEQKSNLSKDDSDASRSFPARYILLASGTLAAGACAGLIRMKKRK